MTMSTATIERPTERLSEALAEQTQRIAISSSRPYWPLPAAQVAGAHLTWPAWVAQLEARLASARLSQEETSAAPA